MQHTTTIEKKLQQLKEIYRTFLPRTLDCPENFMLWDYVKNKLTDSEKQMVESHLKTCERCRGEVLRTEIDRLERELLSEEPPLPKSPDIPPVFPEPDSSIAVWYTSKFAGKVVNAAAGRKEEHSFETAQGTVELKFEHDRERSGRPAYIYLEWTARLKRRSELFVYFLVNPGTDKEKRVMKSMGTKTSYHQLFEEEQLGFNPAREAWAIAIQAQKVRE